jgi:ABC-type multidrug transport system ATPase subunit
VRISIRRVRFAYRAGITVLDIPELDLGPGLTLLRGANGAGKTTLLRLAAGVERPDEGTVAIDGHNLWIDEARARGPIAYVPEQPDLTPYATVVEILLLVARVRGEAAAAASVALAASGLASLGDRTIRELSQGQRRRAVLGAAMIGNPGVLLLDEPLESLDAEMRASLLSWIDAAVERGAAVLVSTHELAPFEGKATRTLRMEAGRLAG